MTQDSAVDLAHEPPGSPINWLDLGPDEARAELVDLDRWVKFLRTAYGLPPSIVPPLWHRHDELIWELSALHLAWLNAYHPDAPLSAPCSWHHDFTLARARLREWVSACGTRLDRDRPTRQTTWPGEATAPASVEVSIADRDRDFEEFVRGEVTRRRRTEHAKADRLLR